MLQASFHLVIYKSLMDDFVLLQCKIFYARMYTHDVTPLASARSPEQNPPLDFDARMLRVLAAQQISPVSGAKGMWST